MLGLILCIRGIFVSQICFVQASEDERRAAYLLAPSGPARPRPENKLRIRRQTPSNASAPGQPGGPATAGARSSDAAAAGAWRSDDDDDEPGTAAEPMRDNPFTSANPVRAAAATAAAAARSDAGEYDEGPDGRREILPGESPLRFACTCELTWHVSPVFYMHPLLVWVLHPARRPKGTAKRQASNLWPLTSRCAPVLIALGHLRASTIAGALAQLRVRAQRH